MAACLITITGTNGVIKIDYKISSVPYSIETSIGSFYIDDTATDVTYTTLSGDLIASSGCLTITELPATCYKVNWKEISTINFRIANIVLGETTYSISNVSFPNSGKSLVDAINDLQIDELKVIGYKLEGFGIGSSEFQISNSYILKVLGEDVPVIIIKSNDNTVTLNINGETTSCVLPITYTSVEPCYSTLPTTTTTTAPPL
jgi:hypothetical protein